METREDMLKALETERLERERLATEQINTILTQYRCKMDVDLHFSGEGRVGMTVKIVGLP